MKITLPFPAAHLFPNRSAGKHWTTTRVAKDKARDDAYLLTKAQPRDFTAGFNGFVEIRLTYCMPDGRHRDLDNCFAASKHAMDGIAEALKVDDKFFSPITLIRGEQCKDGCLIVEVL